jgi:hypothetical protein
MALALAACGGPAERPVDPTEHTAFWLWGGPAPRDMLARAREIYLLDGEVLERGGVRFRALRPEPPRLPGKALWLVVRTDTLAWPEPAHALVKRHLAQWRAAGNRVAGVQIDFDARTRGLGGYAGFLRDIRRRLPEDTRLSITGLMDWSANGDPAALAGLAGTVDEVAIQTYQGRATILGYKRYLGRLDGFPIPFRIGLVEGGRWRQPEGLTANPKFRGYIVFLMPRPAASG